MTSDACLQILSSLLFEELTISGHAITIMHNTCILLCRRRRNKRSVTSLPMQAFVSGTQTPASNAIVYSQPIDEDESEDLD